MHVLVQLQISHRVFRTIYSICLGGGTLPRFRPFPPSPPPLYYMSRAGGGLGGLAGFSARGGGGGPIANPRPGATAPLISSYTLVRLRKWVPDDPVQMDTQPNPLPALVSNYSS